MLSEPAQGHFCVHVGTARQHDETVTPHTVEIRIEGFEGVTSILGPIRGVQQLACSSQLLPQQARSSATATLHFIPL